ncbi:hypothetical protein VitviT2T_021178 [Vitis vinifera]|uniref:Superoxide dismutase copper/zinc binding domain-containing protein n=2 Tax=Vitis vinifera TaxID=29760 RepID=A0ABY9D8Q6_VITVI
MASMCMPLGTQQMLACQPILPYFNPSGKVHGALEDENHHTGDLGNVIIGENGTINFKIVDKQIDFLPLFLVFPFYSFSHT